MKMMGHRPTHVTRSDRKTKQTMNATKRSASRIGLIFCSALAVAATTGCVVHERRTVYVPAPAPVVSVAPAPAVEHPPVVVIQSENDFYEPLGVYGHWEVIGTYGRCWIPGRVELGWRPYSNGYWQRTDAGWYWVSDEPWGWATYHYGRWDFHPNFGWIWVPHTQWAPAWVCWREGGGYVGWAPLRPSVTIDVHMGGVNYEPAFASRAFVFVEHRRMLEPVRPKTVVVNNTTIINKTVNITKVTVVNKTVINEGPRPEAIERASGRKVRPVPVHEFRNQEESTAAARERNIPTANARRAQPPVHTESRPVQPPVAVKHDSQVVQQAPVAPTSDELPTQRVRPAPTPPQPLLTRTEIEKPADEKKNHDRDTAKNVSPPTGESDAKPEPKRERTVRPGRDFHPAARNANAAKPTPQPVASEPVLEETRRHTPAERRAAPTPPAGEIDSRSGLGLETRHEARQPVKADPAPPAPDRIERPQTPTTKPVLDETPRHTPADKKAAPAPPSGEFNSRNDLRPETPREARQPVKTDAAPPAQERTQGPQTSPKEKSRAAERAPANKKAKEGKEQKKNKGEEQEPTKPAPESTRQSP
jgi:Family of unknown function (DUF6600)